MFTLDELMLEHGAREQYLGTLDLSTSTRSSTRTTF